MASNHQHPPGETTVSGRLSSQRVYTGRVISLDIDRVRFPNGTEGELEMIRHPGASAVVPVLERAGEERMVVLIRQYRYAAEGFVYEIPAGRLNSNETPENCARRELKEETGYRAARMTPLTTIFTTPGFTDERIHLFLASGLTVGVSAPESDEVIEVHPTAISEALEMTRSGRITDGKTIIALLFAARFHEIE